MRNGDSRQLGGTILPLQHKGFVEKGWAVDLRNSILSDRVTDRLTGAGDVGHWQYEEDSVGDLIGGFLWRERDICSRPMGAWAFVIPAIAMVGDGGGDVSTPSVGLNIRSAIPTGSTALAPNASGGGGNGKIKDLGPNTGIPIASETYQGDNRFVPMPMKGPVANVADDPINPPPPPPAAGQAGPGILRLGIGTQVYPTTGGQLGFGPGFNFTPQSGVGIGQSGAFNFGPGRANFFGGPRITLGAPPGGIGEDDPNVRPINPIAGLCGPI